MKLRTREMPDQAKIAKEIQRKCVGKDIAKITMGEFNGIPRSNVLISLKNGATIFIEPRWKKDRSGHVKISGLTFVPSWVG